VSASIGRIALAEPFCQAGLEGYSDRAMRLVARRRGCSFAVTEALLDTQLLQGGDGARRALEVDDEDHPLAGQIIGSGPATMAQAAQLLHAAGHDVIDLNFACPVKKTAHARGGHMLSDVARGIEIVKAVRGALPSGAVTTVSLRRSYDDSPAAAERFAELVEAIWANGYAAVRVHARTVVQKYQGRSRSDLLAQLKARWPDKTILGSGDVFTAEDAVRMLRGTGVDAVWIARGAIGNPWIFRDAARLLRGESIAAPSVREQRDALAETFELCGEVHAPELAARRARKFGIKYSRFHPRAGEVKTAFIGARSLQDSIAALARHYAADAPGVWPAPDVADETRVA
jgi:nifR3 family TIM-barrel protein